MGSRPVVRLESQILLAPAAVKDLAALVAEGLWSWRQRGVSTSVETLATAREFVEFGRVLTDRDVDAVAKFRGGGSDGTTAEPVFEMVATMTTKEISKRAKVSDSYVRRVCRGGVLHPYALETSSGWLVESVAVERWREGREAS